MEGLHTRLFLALIRFLPSCFPLAWYLFVCCCCCCCCCLFFFIPFWAFQPFQAQLGIITCWIRSVFSQITGLPGLRVLHCPWESEAVIGRGRKRWHWSDSPWDLTLVHLLSPFALIQRLMSLYNPDFFLRRVPNGIEINSGGGVDWGGRGGSV